MRFPGFAREPSPRRKMALLLVAAAALPLSATLWLAVRQTRALARTAAIERLEARADQVAERMRALYEAGADQVVLNLVTARPRLPYLEELRVLAPLVAQPSA